MLVGRVLPRGDVLLERACAVGLLDWMLGMDVLGRGAGFEHITHLCPAMREHECPRGFVKYGCD